MRFLTFFLSIFVLNICLAQQTPMGIFQYNSDIGNPKLAGSSSYDEVSQTYTLKGGGYNIWFERDEFHFLYNRIEGDFLLTANFEFKGEGSELHRKMGWMIRESLDEHASHISAVNHGDGLTVLQWRPLRGAFMRDPEDEVFAPKSDYNILQLEQMLNDGINGILQVQTHIQSHLIVAASGGMQLVGNFADDLSQPGFNMGVNIFQCVAV